MRVEREITLRAAPEAVYDLVTDPARLGEWVTIHRGLRSAPEGPLRAGSEMVQSLAVAGVSLDIHWTVVRAERPADVLWEGRGPALARARISYAIRPRGRGSLFRYTNELELPGGPLGRIAGAALAGSEIAERGVERSLARFRALLEAAPGE